TANLALTLRPLAAATLLPLVAGCSAKPADTNVPVAAKASGFRVTDEQRKRLRIVTVARSTFQPTLEVTGTVAFNADQSTQVLSPISGPVARLLVNPGAVVSAGQALATVSSPDFA